MVFVVLCPGTRGGSTGSCSGFKASQKTGQQLKVSSDILGEAGNRTCDHWFIRFARVCSNVDDFNNRNLFLTAKLLKQGYRYHKIRKAFSRFYHRHSELIVKYNIGLKTLLQRGISEPIFYGDLVYKFKRIVGKPNFSDQFKKIVKRYIRVGRLQTEPKNPFKN